MATKLKGIRRTGSGWQCYVRIAGEFRSKHFPPDTDVADLKDWIATQKARHQLKDELARPVPVPAGTLAADATAYLEAVRAMRSIKDRRYHVGLWVAALGPLRPRSDITTIEIRGVLADWRDQGLSLASLNRRRTALLHLWTTLDGKSQPSPVRDVPRFREHARPLVLPTVPQALKAIHAVRGRTASQARLLVLLWTGWPAAQLMRLTPEDIDWRRRTALVRGRQKGTGTRDKRLPLLPHAVAALKALKASAGFGPFSTSALHSTLHRACDATGVSRFHPYALRHLFLSTVAASAKDDRVVAELGMHTSLSQTRRYTEQSVAPRLSAGLAKVGAKVARFGVRRAKSKKSAKKRHTTPA